MRTNYPINSHFIQFRCWQRAIFPGSGPPSIVAAKGLYDRVRDGNGWFTLAWSPTIFCFVVPLIRFTTHTLLCTQNHIRYKLVTQSLIQLTLNYCFLQNSIKKSPRPISIAWLKMLPLLHLRPINVVICNGTY